MTLTTIAIGAIGAIVGGSIVTLFTPSLEPIASRLNWGIFTRLHLVDTPNVTITDTYNADSKPYNPGDEIDEFDGVDRAGDDTMQIIQVNLKPEGSIPLNDLRVVLPVKDEFVIGYYLPDSSYQNVQIRPLSGGGAYEPTDRGKTYNEPAYGAVVISSEYVPPPSSDSVNVRFLLDEDPDDSSRTYPEKENGQMYYRWDFHSVSYDKSSRVTGIGGTE